MRQLDDPRNVRLLLDFPARRAEEVLRTDRGRRRDAVAMQIALAVEILLMAPMRASNLAGLHLERHIQRTRTGKDGTVHIVIPGHEVKNGQDLEFPLPPETVLLLDLYLRDFHPRLSDTPSPWLFPGRKNGMPKAVMTLGEQVKAHVFKATGLRREPASVPAYDGQAVSGSETPVNTRSSADISDTATWRRPPGSMPARRGPPASRHFDDEILKLRRSLAARGT